MAITHVATNTATADAAASITIPMPAGLQEGDVVIVAASADGTANLDLSESGGTWTETADLYANDVLDSNLGVYLKVMGVTPDTDVTIQAASGTPNWSGVSSAWRGVDQVTPQDAAATTVTTTNGAQPNPPSITTVTDNARVVVIGSASQGTGTITVPTNYGNLVTAQHSGGLAAVMIADMEIAVAGAENAGVFGLVGSDADDATCAVSMALRSDIGMPTDVALDVITHGSSSAGNVSFTHTPAGTPRGVLVLIVVFNASTDTVTNAVTYGGVTMSEIALSPLIHDGTEDGVLHGFFLGSSIPTGAQTVACSGLADARVSCISLRADADTEVVDTSTIDTTASGDITGTMSLGGRTCFVVENWWSSGDGVTGTDALAGWTVRREVDEGVQTNGVYTYGTIGSSDVTFGVNSVASQEVAVLGVAVSKVAAGGIVTEFGFHGISVGRVGSQQGLSGLMIGQVP